MKDPRFFIGKIKSTAFDLLLRYNLRTIEISANNGDKTHATTAIALAAEIFDHEFYMSSREDFSGTASEAFKHFMTLGWLDGLDPNRYFWTSWYLEKYPDVANAGVNPFIHFLDYGTSEERDPSPLFDTTWYLKNYRNQVGGQNPLVHYLREGKALGFPSRLDDLLSTKARDFPSAQMHLDLMAQNVGSLGVEFGPLRPLAGADNQCASVSIEKVVFTPENYINREINANLAGVPECYLAIVDDAVAFPGRGTILSREGVFLSDENFHIAKHTATPQTKLLEYESYKNDSLAAYYEIDWAPSIKNGLWLSKDYDPNFFHFVMELALKLSVIEHDSLVPKDVPILISDGLPQSLYDLVNIVKAPERRVHKLKTHVPHSIRSLYILSDFSRFLDSYNAMPGPKTTFISHDALRILRERVLTSARDRERPYGPRIFVERNSSRRRLLNQAPLRDALIDKGFEVIDPEMMTLVEQVEAFANAGVIVGSTGAAFTNLLWVPEKSRVVILYPKHRLSNRTFWQELEAFLDLDLAFCDGKPAGIVTGKYAMHDDFEIDIEEVLRLLG